MIHTLHGPPARRIAIMEIPRTERMRLGRVGSIGPGPTTYSGLDVYSGVYPSMRPKQAPSYEDQWMGTILQRQSTARETTPGTLSYTPAPATEPPVNLASWNSWAGPCSTFGASGPAAPSAALQPLTLPSASKFWIYVAAGLGAAASAAYLYESLSREGRR